MQKSTSAPRPITLAATRLPPAESSYPGELMMASDSFDFLAMLRNPAAKPPLILNQLGSFAETRIPTLCAFVVRAARIPARYDASWLEVVMFERYPFARFLGLS